MKRSFHILILSLLANCTPPEIEFPENQSLVVVEGWITNENKEHWIKLSRTVAFDDNRNEEPIEDALVTIRDNTGSVIELSHTTNGIYLTQILSGIQDFNYTLFIELASGEVIRSNSQNLLPVSAIVGLSVDSFIRRNPDTNLDEDIYFPIVTSVDPVDEINFYRYVGYRDGQKLITPEELELVKDQFINGQVLAHNISRFEFSLGEEITIELHSLNEDAFSFLELLRLQTTSLGSSSGTNPASLNGNLYYLDSNEQVLGFFGASAVSSASLIVE